MAESLSLNAFSDLGVPRKISDALAKRGITTAFPIQAATITDALAGRDLCGRAPTGSGKTLAFGVPVAALARKAQPRRPSVLVLVPTRELANQVALVVKPLAQTRNLHTAAFYGGTSIGKDRVRLDRGIDIAIATPGRLADLVQRRFADLSEVRLVVIDEADRMADMGFLPEVKRLLDQTNSERQTLLFSATLDGDVDVLIKRYQRSPARHEIEVAEEDKGDVRHFFWSTPAHDRVALTAEIVREASPAIVFTRTKHAADRVARQLAGHGVNAAAIHGDRSQKQRERALADFTAQRVTTLVATDVAARGIHVDAVEVVVHFDPAGTDKDYVHRSGRTGRAGADGMVVTLVAPDKARDVRTLQRALGLRQHVEPAQVAVMAAAGAGDTLGSTPLPVAPERRTETPKRETPKKGSHRHGGRPHSNGSARSGNPTRSGNPKRSGQPKRNGQPKAARRGQSGR